MTRVRRIAAAPGRRVAWRHADPFEVPGFLTPRFVRRRARLVGSPFWECARCSGHQGGAPTRSPRFCEFGCHDAELSRFEGAIAPGAARL